MRYRHMLTTIQFLKKTVIVISVKHSIVWIAPFIDGHSKEIGTKIGIGNLKQEIR